MPTAATQGPEMATNAILTAAQECGVKHSKVFYNLLYHALMMSVTKEGENYGVILLLSDYHWKFTSDELPKGKLSNGIRVIMIHKENHEADEETRERVKGMMRRSLKLLAEFPNWRAAEWNEMHIK